MTDKGIYDVLGEMLIPPRKIGGIAIGTVARNQAAARGPDPDGGFCFGEENRRP